MKEQIQTQVLGARSEPSKDGRSIKHIVSISGGVAPSGTQYPAGDYVGFDPAIIDAANAKVNAGLTTAEVEIKLVPKQRGDGYWTNYNIEAVGDNIPPLAQPAQGGTPVQQQAAPQPTTQAQTAPTPTVHPALAQASEERSEVNRRSAVHAGTEYVGNLLKAGLLTSTGEASLALQAVIKDLTAYIETGGFGSFESEAPIVPTATTPQEVVEQLPAEAQQMVGVGVPFDATPAA